MPYQRITLSTGATMDVYAPVCPLKQKQLHKAIVICPGGGYGALSKRESEPIALRFAGMGYAAFVVNYHVHRGSFPMPQQDAACAVATVRARAEEWEVDPRAVMIAGFSAGGHLAASLGVLWEREDLWKPLGLTCEQVRPDALMLAYALLTVGEYGHHECYTHLTGTDDIQVHQQQSLEKLVTERTPPAFIWHTWPDPVVPVENALLFALALKKHNVLAEVHLYPYGGHGAALGTAQMANYPDQLVPELQNWPEMADRFFQSIL